MGKGQRMANIKESRAEGLCAAWKYDTYFVQVVLFA